MVSLSVISNVLSLRLPVTDTPAYDACVRMLKEDRWSFVVEGRPEGRFLIITAAEKNLGRLEKILGVTRVVTANDLQEVWRTRDLTLIRNERGIMPKDVSLASAPIKFQDHSASNPPNIMMTINAFDLEYIYPKLFQKNLPEDNAVRKMHIYGHEYYVNFSSESNQIYIQAAKLAHEALVINAKKAGLFSGNDIYRNLYEVVAAFDPGMVVSIYATPPDVRKLFTSIYGVSTLSKSLRVQKEREGTKPDRPPVVITVSQPQESGGYIAPPTYSEEVQPLRFEKDIDDITPLDTWGDKKELFGETDEDDRRRSAEFQTDMQLAVDEYLQGLKKNELHTDEYAELMAAIQVAQQEFYNNTLSQAADAHLDKLEAEEEIERERDKASEEGRQFIDPGERKGAHFNDLPVPDFLHGTSYMASHVNKKLTPEDVEQLQADSLRRAARKSLEYGRFLRFAGWQDFLNYAQTTAISFRDEILHQRATRTGRKRTAVLTEEQIIRKKYNTPSYREPTRVNYKQAPLFVDLEEEGVEHFSKSDDYTGSRKKPVDYDRKQYDEDGFFDKWTDPERPTKEQNHVRYLLRRAAKERSEAESNQL